MGDHFADVGKMVNIGFGVMEGSGISFPVYCRIYHLGEELEIEGVHKTKIAASENSASTSG